MRASRGALHGAAAFALALFVLAGTAPARELSPPPVRSIEVDASPLTHFRLGSRETRFGALEFAGGFTMRSADPDFGQLSALRFLTPGGDFIGVADHGYWFFGTIVRDAAGVPAGVENFRMQPMAGPDGAAFTDKDDGDAEGLDVSDGIATVAFERKPRVAEYRMGPDGFGAPVRDIDFVIPRHELRYNQGMETVARSPSDSVQRGARIVVAERSIDANGDIFAAILEGPEKGVFKVRRTDAFDVTDGVFLPDGDLLLLERRFSTALGVAMRIRRIAGGTVRAGALVDGHVLVEADLGYHIDNMEGIDAWRREDGATIVSLVSDDNQFFLQRTIYLEFVLAD